MQRWEYRVVSFPTGGYTAALNEYARDGWELFAVTPDAPPAAPQESGSKVPMPRMVGAIEDAASKLNQFGEQQQSAATTPLLWVLRRALDDWSAATEEA